MAGFNGKHIKTISTATGKTNPYKNDVIVDPEGQWKYPGQVTKIPSGDITMKGVNYPVLGVDNLGNKQMMYPGMDYSFPGQSVTEYPQLKGGGWLDKYNDEDVEEYKHGGPAHGMKYLRALTRNTTNRNIQSSLNFLMARNYEIYGKAGKRFYDPKSKFETGGWLDQYK